MNKIITVAVLSVIFSASTYAVEKTLIYTEYKTRAESSDSPSRDDVMKLIKSDEATITEKHSFQISGNVSNTNSFLKVIPYLHPTEESAYVIRKDLKAGLIFESFADFTNMGVTTLTLKTQRHKARRAQFIPVIEWNVGKPVIVVYTELELDAQTYIDNTVNIVFTGSENHELTVITLEIIDQSLSNKQKVKQIKIK